MQRCPREKTENLRRFNNALSTVSKMQDLPRLIISFPIDFRSIIGEVNASYINTISPDDASNWLADVYDAIRRKQEG